MDKLEGIACSIFDWRKESYSLKVFSKVLTATLLTMGIILAIKYFYPNESLKDLTETVVSDTETHLKYELKPGVKVKCPYCQQPLVHCGYHKRKLTNLCGVNLLVTLQRMKCNNEQCEAVRKNRCSRSTHVIYPSFIIPSVRYHAVEIILLLLFNFSLLHHFLERLKQHQFNTTTSSIEDFTRYYYRYHGPLIKRYLDYFYIKHKKKYLYMNLIYKDIFRKGKLFARFWIVKHYKCQRLPWRFRLSELTDFS